MSNLAVNVAVMQDGKILLTKREDFETWILPSGGVENGESLAQAAIRETKEETGVDVELTRLVGIYSRVGNVSPGQMVLFAARPIGGERRCQAGACGLVVLQEIKSPFMPDKITRKELYEMRDQSGLSRQEFYLQMLEKAEIHEVMELGINKA